MNQVFVTKSGADADNLVMLDKRDLFDAVRSAIKDAVIEKGYRPDGADLFALSTDRANNALHDLVEKGAVPPAGGEPQVVGWRDSGGRCITHGGSGRYSNPLVRLEDHRAHVTLLQAEVELLKAQAENDREANTAIRAERDHYKAELTKARNLYDLFPAVLPHPPRHWGFLEPDCEVPSYTLEQMKEYGAACVAAFNKQNGERT